jgi:hypothetical protein
MMFAWLIGRLVSIIKDSFVAKVLCFVLPLKAGLESDERRSGTHGCVCM